jgi:PAS domain S-box-containing protein
MRRAAEPFANRLNFTWLNESSFDEMLKRAANLTPNYAIFYYLVSEDAKGIPYSQDRALEALRAVATVPIFGAADYQLGRGIVGGPLTQTQALGRQAADVAVRILNGEPAGEIKSPTVEFGAPMYDWRELRRWGINEAQLPSDSIVKFREPTVWQQYYWQIMLIAIAFLAQTLIASYVLVQNRRRRAAEIRLTQSEERMTLVAASTNTGLWQFRAEDEPIWATEHCHFILGLAEDALLSFETLSQSIHPDDRRSFVRAIRDAATTGRPIDREFRVMLPGGEIRWIALKGYPRRGEHDRAYYINGVLSDVTAVKAAEGEAELQRREIARLMRQSVLGELSGAIAHELNQPLTAILSNAEAAHDLLGQKKVDLQKIQEIVADIIEEDTRASDVMSRIRKLLRKGESRPEIVDLNQLVNSTLHLLHGELVRRNIHTETALAGGLPAISGDPVELQQVLLNALMNAMEAMSAKPAGQRALKVATRADRSQVQAVIVDSGDGISPEHRARIFQPFFTTKAHGLGLGLSICSTIMKAHGGKLGIENNTGGGATVTVTLPIGDSVAVRA